MDPHRRRLLRAYLALVLLDEVRELEDQRVAAAAERRRPQGRRRCWVREIFRKRYESQYYTLMPDLRARDEDMFRKYLRVPPALFDEILRNVQPLIQCQNTRMRAAIPAGMALAVTLRHLATGDSYTSLAFDFRISKQAISKIVIRVCDAIIFYYKNEVIHFPQTKEEWKQIAKGFSDVWQFHHCLGALDGKHIRMKKPVKSGTMFFNYKKFFSIVLMALVDHEYKFIWYDLGANGSASDAQIFNSSDLLEVMTAQTLQFPDADPLPGDNVDMPYFFIGDEAFALKTWMMKPYSRQHLTREETAFNYRLSRARRVVENAFGILSMRWRVLTTSMQHELKTVEFIVEACIVLHNLMRNRYPVMHRRAVDREDENGNIIPGEWRQNSQVLQQPPNFYGSAATRAGQRQRLALQAYYSQHHL